MRKIQRKAVIGAIACAAVTVALVGGTNANSSKAVEATGEEVVFKDDDKEVSQEPIVTVQKYEDTLTKMREISVLMDVKGASLETEEEPAEVPAPEPEEITVSIVDQEDIELLAHIMYCENGISSDEALLLTGIVVMKRVKSSKYPDTLREVIFQKGQYSPTWNGSWESKSPDERSLEMARKILVEQLEKDYPDTLVFQAEFKQGVEVYRQIGNQYFCLMGE